MKLVCCKERGNSLMAKVINLFESRNQEKKDVDCIKEVLTEDGLFARKKAVAYMLLDRG